MTGYLLGMRQNRIGINYLLTVNLQKTWTEVKYY